MGGVPRDECAPPTQRGAGAVVSWGAQVDRFLEWKKAEAAVGDEWLSRMRWELGRVPRLLERAGGPSGPLTPQTFQAEFVALFRRNLPWEKATFALHFAALRQFLAWAENPIATRRSVWALPSGEPTHRRWLTKEQLVRLYRSSDGRARLLIALEGLNGLRRVEVLRLRATDVGLKEGCLRVLGKGRHGGKWRQLPIHPALAGLLERAIGHLAPTDRLLPLSRSGADLLLARAARAAGLPASGTRVSHHDLRRTFGRLAHQAGMDLVQLKNLLGHSSVEMTVHYIGLDSDTMREGLQRFRDSLGSLDGSRASPGPSPRRPPRVALHGKPPQGGTR